MAHSSDVVDRVLRYKRQLQNPQAPQILKTLKKLKDLEVTLDILAETGIGKTVNTLRRHEAAGDLAKSLVRDWKKLMVKGSKSPTANNPADKPPQKQNPSLHFRGAADDLNNNCLKDEREDEPANKKSKKELKKQHFSMNNIINKPKATEKEKKNLSNTKKRLKNQKPEKSLSKKQIVSHKRKKYNRLSDDDDDDDDGLADRDKITLKETESKGQLCSESVHKTCKDRESDAQSKKRKKHKEEKSQSPLSKEKNPKHEDNGDAEEEPTMSFESYLNYDDSVSQRRPRPKAKKQWSKPASKTEPTKVKAPVKPPVMPLAEPPVMPPPEPLVQPCPDSPRECVQNIPAALKFSESAAADSWFPEGTSRKSKEKGRSCEVLEESVFTGQRLNSKMQVYSGAKTLFLPTMMSLQQQCLRTLQNHLHLLSDTGGVPFLILEPVLERATPEQLLHIEEHNPAYVGDTDLLWGKHCRRDFRDGKLQEYESWREMYLRLSEEREQKLQLLTKTIVSAHTSRPKGRQVKMAFLHSVAKPPRDVRIKQEVHGTAAPPTRTAAPPTRTAAPPTRTVALPTSTAAPPTSTTAPPTSTSVPVADCRPRASSSSSAAPEPRKKTKVAPMMKKSLKAFQKHFGRR